MSEKESQGQTERTVVIQKERKEEVQVLTLQKLQFAHLLDTYLVINEGITALNL
jgi:hypothetical protein